MTSPRRRRTAVLAAALALATGCGTTVQQTGGARLAVDGLAPGVDPLTGARTDVAVPDGVPGAVAPGQAAEPGAAAPLGGGSQPGQAPAGGADPVPGASGPAVAAPAPAERDRRPLRLGLLYVNNDAAGSAGVDNGNTFTPRKVLEAMVRATNARGGLAGRKVEPTFVELKSSSSSYSSDLQAACAQLVEDAKVGLVMSFLGLASEQFSACMARGGVVHVNGSNGLGDVTSISREPTTLSTGALSTDRRVQAVLERLTASGHLTRQSRLGLLVEGCPFNTRAVERTLLPTAKRLGLTVAQTQTTRCFDGIGDLGGLSTDAQNAVLPFRSEGVDRVLIVSAVEANVLFVFATAAESQGYRPGYALTSVAAPNVVKANVPAQQLTNAKGVGWLPSIDDAGPPAATATAKACVDLLRKQGVAPASSADHYFVFGPCDTFGIADRVLTVTGGATAPVQWFPALSAIGTGFASASTLEGRTDFRSGRRDGPALGRTFSYVPSCSCFRYAGASFPL